MSITKNDLLKMAKGYDNKLEIFAHNPNADDLEYGETEILGIGYFVDENGNPRIESGAYGEGCTLGALIKFLKPFRGTRIIETDEFNGMVEGWVDDMGQFLNHTIDDEFLKQCDEEDVASFKSGKSGWTKHIFFTIEPTGDLR